MNAADAVRTSARRAPEKAALIFQRRAVSYDELDGWVDATAAALADLGVGRGDRVALLAGNVPEFVHALYGTMRAGAVACPLNVQLTPEEIGPILGDAGASVAVVELPYLTGVLAVRDRVPTLRTVLVIGGPPAPSGTVSLEEVQRAAGDPPTIETEAGDLALLAYTSGTTDAAEGGHAHPRQPGGEPRPDDAVPALAEASDDVVLLALPLFHIYGAERGPRASRCGPAPRRPGRTVRSRGDARADRPARRDDPARGAADVRRRGSGGELGAGPDAVATRSAGGLRGRRRSRRRSSPRSGTRFGVTIWEGYGLTEAAPA